MPAKRVFTQASNGHLYCDLRTKFRVGAIHLMWGVAEAKRTKVTNSNGSDPYAPIVPTDVATSKLTIKGVMAAVAEQLKHHG